MEYQEILKEIEARAEIEGELPIIGPVKGAVLAETVRKYRPKRILEVGTLVGYSSIIMAANLPDGSRVTTIEVNPAQAAKALININRAGLADKIEIIVGRADDVIAGLEGVFDMLFIDGEMKDYYNYLKSAEPKLAPDAVVVADNVGKFADKMREFLEYIRHCGRYECQTFDFGSDAVEVSLRRPGAGDNTDFFC